MSRNMVYRKRSQTIREKIQKEGTKQKLWIIELIYTKTEREKMQ